MRRIKWIIFKNLVGVYPFVRRGLSSLLTWKEGWLCNALSKLPQNCADNSHPRPPSSCRSVPVWLEKVGQDFPPPSLSVRACGLSLSFSPSVAQLIADLRKEKRESRTGYTREKHDITATAGCPSLTKNFCVRACVRAGCWAETHTIAKICFSHFWKKSLHWTHLYGLGWRAWHAVRLFV